MLTKTVSITWIVVAWLVVGVVVALGKDYGKGLDSASDIATLLLAIVLWPIPATDGMVLIRF